ncbi:MAG: Sua5/YciO/YrdC/YwlC family protein, partial [Bacteroidetes bacterium]|nr:Sua5/YciO/YrdC/YwlC family protein [Bacteroidota bacterium]
MTEELKLTLETLRSGGIILYPTDTIWGIGCDACFEPALKRIMKIKGRSPAKPFILLLDNVKSLQDYIEDVPQTAIDLIEKTTSPLTLIYQNPMNLPTLALSEAGTVAIRITRDPFCIGLIEALGNPIVSTSAN